MDRGFWGFVLFIVVVSLIWFSSVKEIGMGAVVLLLLSCALVFMLLFYWREE